MTDLDVVAHLQRLRRYARFLCRDAADADDLVQDTLVKAIHNADRFRPDADLRAWLFSILHNTFVSGTGPASAGGALPTASRPATAIGRSRRRKPGSSCGARWQPWSVCRTTSGASSCWCRSMA